MPERIPQSVAKDVVFRAYLSSDGKTPATGKTIAITISKNKGAFGNPSAGATNATEITSGFYYFNLSTTDTGTQGPLAWRGAEGTIDDAGDVYSVTDPHNAGFDALPSVASGSSGCVPTTGNGSNQIALSSGAVQIQAGSGTGQLDFTSGVVKGNLAQILGTALTESVAGQVEAAFKKFFDVGTPTGTVNSLPNAVPGASGGVFIAGSNAGTTVNFTGNLSGSVGSVTGAVGSVAGNVVGTIGNLSSGAKNDVLVTVWDSSLAGHTAGGTFGGALNSAGSAGDPWNTLLPGTYASGTAGNIIGNNVNAPIAGVKAKTDQLTFTTANKVDAAFNVAADFPQACADKAWSTSGRTLSSAANITSSGTVTFTQTGDSYARLGAPAGANVSADIASIKADTTGVLSHLPPMPKKNQAINAFEFPMTDSSTHALKPGLGTSITAQRSLDGGAFATCTNVPAEVSNGVYKIDLSAADMNGSTVTLRFSATGADDRLITILTQS
jgi:hypothetical protein